MVLGSLVCSKKENVQGGFEEPTKGNSAVAPEVAFEPGDPLSPSSWETFHLHLQKPLNPKEFKIILICVLWFADWPQG